MKYLKLTQGSEQYAELISRAIWSARYPEEIRVGNEITNKYCSYIKHPSLDLIALVFSDEQIPIHSNRKIQPLLDVILQPLTNQSLKNIVTNHLINFDWVNTPTTIENLLPPIYLNNLITEEQAVSEGWFNNDQESI